ncbi:MAG TPA: glycosyltransferase family 39 protein [Bacteroidales bacterium]|nr:glycosyltransferase family 39 protein [Bacteroidales bacterium]
MKERKNNISETYKHKTRAGDMSLRKKWPAEIRTIFFLLILVFILYGNTIPNHYSMDDEFVTFNNPLIKKGISAVPEIFTTHYVNNARQHYDYRPVVKLSFALEYALFRNNPHISHLFNVLLYFVLCATLFLVLKKLLHNYHPWLALMICLLFAAHPVHTEVVASLKNRDELLSMLGCVLSWYFIIKYTDKRKWHTLTAAVLFFVLAFYSKPNAIVYAVIIPLSLYFFKEMKLSKLLILAAIMLLFAVILNVIPAMFLSPPNREVLYFENPLFYEQGLWLRLGTALVVVLFYMKLLFFPHPLLFYYGYDMIPVTTPANTGAIISLILCTGLLVVALRLFRRRHIMSFGILAFYISIFIFSNIFIPMPGIVAERFAFMASLGFVMAVSVMIFLVFRLDINHKGAFMLKKIKYPAVIFLLILFLYTVQTIARNADWRDFRTLYSHDIEYLDRSAKANALYASFLYSEIYRNKDPQKQRALALEAQRYYGQAVNIYPGYAIAWNNLGILYFRYQHDLGNASGCWKKAAACDTAYAEPWLNIATAYDEMNLPDSAEKYYLKCVEVRQNYTAAYQKLAEFYYRQGDVPKAIITNKKIMETDPASDVPYINIGNYSLLAGDTINAIALWETAIKKYPYNPDLCLNLAKYFEHAGNPEKASYYQKLSKNK